MIIFVCDKCAKFISEEDFRSGQTQKKNGSVICQDCSIGQKATKESFNCDRCAKKFSIELLRTGEALLVSQKQGKKGQIYCNKCRSYAERKSREMVDLKYLVIIFALLLGVPIVIGFTMTMHSYLKTSQKETSKTPQAEDLTKKFSKMLELQRQQLLEELKKGRQKNTFFQPETQKTFPQKQEIKENKTQPKESKNAKKFNQEASNTSSLLLVDMVNAIEQKAIKNISQQIKTGSTQQKLQMVLQIAHKRERAAIPALIKTLDDTDPVVRSFAASTLGALGAHQSVKKLFSIISDPNPMVRTSVTQALTLLTREEFKNVLDLSKAELDQLIKILRRGKK